MQKSGTLIALAWPETKVIAEGKWYDVPLGFLGFIKHGYYTAGHAALLLVNHQTNDILYYDFGRYHTPYQKGRVRSKVTDPELTIKTKAIFHNNKLINIETILQEVNNNKACHGDGKLMASELKNINFEKAKTLANAMQNKGAICYGPIKKGGTNCSRFVSTIAKNSVNNIIQKILLHIPYTISPTPKSNIRLANSHHYYFLIDERQKAKNVSPFIPKLNFNRIRLW
jgi:hypothetical protein